MSFFEELKRRNVFRVAIAYIITAWLLLQVVDLVLENINAPDWIMQVFMLALVIGFPLAVIFAWAFELTPEGVKRESQVDRSRSITPATGRKLDRSIIFVLVVALAWFAWDKFQLAEPAPKTESTSIEQVQRPPAPDQQSPGASSSDTSVAVLPFINLSDDKENEYFSDGISEELLNVLVRIEGLRVPSRTSSFTFKGSGKKVTEIGRELQVDHVLEGSVRKAGERIRVTAQLIDVDTDTHLWSETYTRQLDDIFAVQDEIAQAIVDALKVTLSGAEEQSLSAHSTSSAEAYNKFLLGRHLWNQRTSESLLAAINPLVEAVEMDPNFDRAWAALADTYVLIPEYFAGPMDQYVPLAREAIEKTLAINPRSAHGLTTSAYLKYMFEYDFKGAQKDFLKAIEIEPSYATAHQWYGELLSVLRKPDAAIEELKLARQLDPLSPIIPHVMGWVLEQTDRTEEAYQYYQEALEIDPHFRGTIGNLVGLNMRTGRFDEARKRALEIAGLTARDPSLQLAIIDALENPERAGVALELLMSESVSPSGVIGKAVFLLYLGEDEMALDIAEKSFAEGDPYAVHMNRLWVYERLRGHPRFQALLKQMNLMP